MYLTVLQSATTNNDPEELAAGCGLSRSAANWPKTAVVPDYVMNKIFNHGGNDVAQFVDSSLPGYPSAAWASLCFQMKNGTAATNPVVHYWVRWQGSAYGSAKKNDDLKGAEANWVDCNAATEPWTIARANNTKQLDDPSVGAYTQAGFDGADACDDCSDGLNVTMTLTVGY